MAITVAPNLVEFLETHSGGCEVTVRRTSDDKAVEKGLRLAADALFDIEHPLRGGPRSSNASPPEAAGPPSKG